MTYSYLVRAWALEHMHRGVLGRGVIADSCDVAPKTVTSWFRASDGREPSLLKTHREYTRTIANLLYESFPQNIEQIAKKFRITPRIILDRRMQVRFPRYQSELIWATRLALICLHDRISEYFDIEHDQLLLLQNKLPGSNELETMVFAVYGRRLKNNICMAAYVQARRRVVRELSCKKWHQAAARKIIESLHSRPQAHQWSTSLPRCRSASRWQRRI